MVKLVTGLGRSGLQDWLIQRVTAIILSTYLIFLTIFFLQHSELDYETWQALHRTPWMRYANLLAIMSLLMHGWIGIWTVLTDYVKLTQLRFFLEIFILLALLWCFVWGVQIIWSM